MFPSKGGGTKRFHSAILERDSKPKQYPPKPVIFPLKGSGDSFHHKLVLDLMYSEGFMEHFKAKNDERKVTLVKIQDIFYCHVTLMHRHQKTALSAKLKLLVPLIYSQTTTATLRYKIARYLSQT